LCPISLLQVLLVYWYTYKSILPDTHSLPVTCPTFYGLLLQFHFLFQRYLETLAMLELFLHHEDLLKIMYINDTSALCYQMCSFIISYRTHKTYFIIHEHLPSYKRGTFFRKYTNDGLLTILYFSAAPGWSIFTISTPVKHKESWKCTSTMYKKC